MPMETNIVPGLSVWSAAGLGTVMLLAIGFHLRFFFFFNDTATTEIYTLSLHDALPISRSWWPAGSPGGDRPGRECSDRRGRRPARADGDRKSTRLNSSHSSISYAV